MAVSLLTLAPVQRLGYDSYWNVFIARQDLWNFWEEIGHGEHPPLYFFLVSAATSLFGFSAIAYRLVSILPAIVSAWLLAAIVWRTTGNLLLSIAATAAFGLSSNLFAIALEVRGYSLCTAFTLAACVSYLDWIGAPAHLRSTKFASAGFAVAMSAAILTEYSALFFLATAICAPVLIAIVDSEWRRQLFDKCRSQRLAATMMFGVPVALATSAFAAQAIHWIDRVSHVNEFMFNSSVETPWAFLGRNVLNLALMMLPAWSGFTEGPGALALLGVWSGRVALAAFGGICLVGIAILVQSRQHHRAFVALMFALMFGMNALTGLAHWYPFGGMLRHEFFLIPFAIAGSFSLLEAVRRRVPAPLNAQALWASAAGFGLLLSVVSWASVHRVVQGPMFQTQMDRFTALVGPETIFVDQFNFINVFSSYHDWEWTVLPQRDRDLQLWRVTKGPIAVQVCRERLQWQLDLSAPATYRQARKCLENTDSVRVSVFRVQPPGMAPQWDVPNTASLVDSLSLEANLQPTIVHVDGRHVYALFTRRDE
jgi:4-amino-4-deoxy-L-arabinose transferase-like glycosyltransferase